jgi:hypothetical protein
MSTCIGFITYQRPWGRPAALSLVNEHMACIRRVIIEPRYRGLGLANWPMAETMPLGGTAMVEAVSVMGRVHLSWNRGGDADVCPRPENRTHGCRTGSGRGRGTFPINIERLDPSRRIFIDCEMDHFCQTFTNRRGMPVSFRRRGFVLSKLSACGASCLWHVESP